MTSEQRAVARLNADHLCVVQAGAGTGKTHTLIERIAFLAEEGGLDPGDDLLVLSFSRAAIGELRRRVAAHPRSLPYVEIRTFDSLATAMLDEADPDGSWVTGRYDDRIRAATSLLDNPTAALRETLTVRHLLIDEAQDLVGTRADLVTSLLRFTGAAFTIFTDAAQAIYGFNSESGRVDKPPCSFVDGLAGVTAGRTVERHTLTAQHRAGSAETTRVMAYGTVLADDAVAVDEATAGLHELMETLPPLANINALSRSLKRQSGCSTAILCRWNTQALLMSEELTAIDVPHRLQRHAADRAIGAWLTRLAQTVDGHLLSKRVFDGVFGQLDDQPGLSEDLLWRSLQRMDPRARNDVNLRTVAARIRRGDIPEELNLIVRSNVVVSTIHRAKGLEFDRVVVVPSTRDDPDRGEENRVLYVGLSRARQDVLILRGYRTGALQKAPPPIGRVIEAGYPRGRKPMSGIEILPTDTDSARPAGASIEGPVPTEIQAHILSQVHAGDPVTLALVSPRRQISTLPTYSVLHEGHAVAETSEQFGDDVNRLVRGPSSAWPSTIHGVRVQMIDTVAGDETIARNVGLSRSGLWARVCLQGLGRFTPHPVGTP